MYVQHYKFSVKGVIKCKIHFYMLFELKCVLAVCVHNHPFTSSCAHIILALMVNRFGLMSAMEGSERPFYASSDSPP